MDDVSLWIAFSEAVSALQHEIHKALREHLQADLLDSIGGSVGSVELLH